MFDPSIASMDNPPTYPVGLHHGLTLRDWFAGQALAGIMANTATAEDGYSHSSVAGMAYAVADAMFKARKVAPPEK